MYGRDDYTDYKTEHIRDVVYYYYDTFTDGVKKDSKEHYLFNVVYGLAATYFSVEC